MTAPDWARSSNVTQAPARIADEELAAILRRAAIIGIPAWRVTTALGLPPPGASPP